MKSMAWQRQSATAWTELYKEFAAHSQEMSDALWKTWTSKEGLQRRENVSLPRNITSCVEVVFFDPPSVTLSN